MMQLLKTFATQNVVFGSMTIFFNTFDIQYFAVGVGWKPMFVGVVVFVCLPVLCVNLLFVISAEAEIKSRVFSRQSPILNCFSQ